MNKKWVYAALIWVVILLAVIGLSLYWTYHNVSSVATNNEPSNNQNSASPALSDNDIANNLRTAGFRVFIGNVPSPASQIIKINSYNALVQEANTLGATTIMECGGSFINGNPLAGYEGASFYVTDPNTISFTPTIYEWTPSS